MVVHEGAGEPGPSTSASSHRRQWDVEPSSSSSQHGRRSAAATQRHARDGEDRNTQDQQEETDEFGRVKRKASRGLARTDPEGSDTSSSRKRHRNGGGGGDVRDFASRSGGADSDLYGDDARRSDPPRRYYDRQWDSRSSRDHRSYRGTGGGGRGGGGGGGGPHPYSRRGHDRDAFYDDGQPPSPADFPPDPYAAASMGYYGQPPPWARPPAAYYGAPGPDARGYDRRREGAQRESRWRDRGEHWSEQRPRSRERSHLRDRDGRDNGWRRRAARSSRSPSVSSEASARSSDSRLPHRRDFRGRQHKSSIEDQVPDGEGVRERSSSIDAHAQTRRAATSSAAGRRDADHESLGHSTDVDESGKQSKQQAASRYDVEGAAAEGSLSGKAKLASPSSLTTRQDTNGYRTRESNGDWNGGEDGGRPNASRYGSQSPVGGRRTRPMQSGGPRGGPQREDRPTQSDLPHEVMESTGATDSTATADRDMKPPPMGSVVRVEPASTSKDEVPPRSKWTRENIREAVTPRPHRQQLEVQPSPSNPSVPAVITTLASSPAPASTDGDGKTSEGEERDDASDSGLELVPRACPTEMYTRIAQVGEGTYGQVFKAKSEFTGILVALKKIRMEAEKDGFPITAMREIKLLQMLRHPNVVRLHEMMTTSVRGSVYMVFEYLEHDLNGVLHHPDVKFSPAHLKSLSSQLLTGLDYLHQKSVLHRDLKGSNILLNNAGQLKLADFGLARLFAKRRQGDYTNRVVTLWYRPPELLLGATRYGSEVDAWGAGCIFMELFTRRAAFQGADEIHQVQTIVDVLGPMTQSRWEGADALPWWDLVKPTAPVIASTTAAEGCGQVEDGTVRDDHFWSERFRSSMLTHGVPESALDVIQALLIYDPQKRATARQALEMDYFRVEKPRAVRPAEVLRSLKGEWHELESKRARAKNRSAAQAAAAMAAPDSGSVAAGTRTAGGGK